MNVKEIRIIGFVTCLLIERMFFLNNPKIILFEFQRRAEESKEDEIVCLILPLAQLGTKFALDYGNGNN